MDNKGGQAIALFGAGKVGIAAYNTLKKQGLADYVKAFCTTHTQKEHVGFERPVLSYEECKSRGLAFVISVEEPGRSFSEIEALLVRDGQRYYKNIYDYEMNALHYDRVRINRENCAIFHISDMDGYFSRAELEKNLDVFWNKNSPFYRCFQKLNLDNIVELACGRGRHVPQYYSGAKNITLVDILEKNIAFCKERFAGLPHIAYYKNDGYSLSELPDGQYTALFTYDSMVHFELIDVYHYLRETYRILAPGGMGLFHHSNDSTDYHNSWDHTTNPGGRSYMNQGLFAYLAYRSGLDMVDQIVIDWGGVPNLDCISLVQKPL